jgi:hypothetical protein
MLHSMAFDKVISGQYAFAYDLNVHILPYSPKKPTRLSTH